LFLGPVIERLFVLAQSACFSFTQALNLLLSVSVAKGVAVYSGITTLGFSDDVLDPLDLSPEPPVIASPAATSSNPSVNLGPHKKSS
jgi:hypothetical protein